MAGQGEGGSIDTFFQDQCELLEWIMATQLMSRWNRCTRMAW